MSETNGNKPIVVGPGIAQAASSGSDAGVDPRTLESATVPQQLEQAPLAYENNAFVESPEGRPMRIMAEYSEPMARFRRERIQDTVVFFGSARFRALDVASHELELLANTGSAAAAPAEEQPARKE